MDFDKFNNLISRTSCLVTYFSHDECNVCKVLRPQIEQFVNEKPDVNFLYVNTVRNPEIAGQKMVFAVPTIIVFYQGQEAKRFSRHFSIRDLEEILKRILGK